MPDIAFAKFQLLCSMLQEAQRYVAVNYLTCKRFAESANSAESCIAISNPASIIPSKREAEPVLDAPSAKNTRIDNDLPEQEPPMIALSELQWPPDPLEEGPNALHDPLNRDEPKPLLHSELMAIGKPLHDWVDVNLAESRML